MGYSHGEKWDDEIIVSRIRRIVSEFGFNRMPTKQEIEDIVGNSGLTNAIAKRGGFSRFASILSLEQTDCATRFGQMFESLCKAEIQERFGYDTKKMSTKYPYDLLVENCVKVDVKASHIFKSKDGANYYSFNIEKRNPTCDIFVCYCLGDKNTPFKTLIIPASVLTGKKQLSIGISSRYDQYRDTWRLIRTYVDFFQSVGRGPFDSV